MPLLFSYGTLQDPAVQVSTFGRRLDGQRDALPGFEPSRVPIDDAQVRAATGRTHHANVTLNGRDDSRVIGTVFEITDAELAAADRYEQAAAYTRIPVVLASGKEAWVYVHAGVQQDAGLLQLLRDLIAHKGDANAAMLAAIRDTAAAAADRELSELLQHVLLANRFWLLTVLGVPFVRDSEGRAPDSFDELVERYRITHEQESAWMAGATEAELRRTLADPRIPGGACSVADAMLQVCLHSQGHRAQCATLLRRLGGVPPTTDFIVWRAQKRGRDADAAAWSP